MPARGLGVEEVKKGDGRRVKTVFYHGRQSSFCLCSFSFASTPLSMQLRFCFSFSFLALFFFAGGFLCLCTMGQNRIDTEQIAIL